MLMRLMHPSSPNNITLQKKNIFLTLKTFKNNTQLMFFEYSKLYFGCSLLKRSIC